MREFLTEKDLDEIGLFSRAHRDRLRKAGKFPLPIKIGGGPGAKSLTPTGGHRGVKGRRPQSRARQGPAAPAASGCVKRPPF